MTLYQFRQGIVSYPEVVGVGQAFLQENPTSITLLADNGPTVINFAHYNTNYEFTESLTVADAWNLTGAPRPVWIYWDLDQTTGVRTFGQTEVRPVSGPTQPINPAADQHWFDTVNTVMKVHVSGGVWVSRIRVFAAQIASILPMGSNPVSPFAGSQVGLNNTPNRAGRILFDESGLPVVRTLGTFITGSPQTTVISNGTFFTTESEFFAGASRINGIRLESDVVTASAQENMAGYAVVQWNGFSVVGLANYNDVDDTTIGILTTDALIGESQTVIVQGTITNQNWNWQTVGVPLWVQANGVLVDIDPNISNSITYPQSKSPVARVLSNQQIIFMQGLGARGPQGIPGEVADQIVATTTVLGNVTITCDGSPQGLVVGDCDSRIAGGPFTPFAHLTDVSAHDALNIDFSSIGNIASGNVQAAIEELDGEKVAIDGDTMTGALVLNGDPTIGLHAATKAYVDNLAAGLDPKESVRVATIADLGGVYNPSGQFIVGPLSIDGITLAISDRVLVKDQADAKQNGIYIVASISGTSTLDRAEDHDGSPTNEVSGGNFTFTELGATNEGTGWVLQGDGILALNTDDLDWVQFSGGVLTAGTNIDITGSIISVVDYGSPGGTINAASLQGSVPSDFAPTLHRHPYDLAAFIAGVAVVGDPVGSWLLTRDLDFTLNFTSSLANAGIPGASLSSVLNIQQNGTNIGTITFPSAANVGIFASGSPEITSFSSGDLITLAWGSPAPDPAIKNVTITIETCADAPAC